MLELIKVVILAIIQGITEFLPVSSTGHLIVATEILDYQALGNTFEIFIQLGSVIAVLVYYARDLTTQARMLTSDGAIRNFWLYIILAFIPAGVTGFFLSDWIDRVLFNPTVVAIALIAGGVAFLIVEGLPRVKISTNEVTEVTKITLRQSVGVGLCQTLALIPGVSRSGASIIGGILVGMNRQTATRFSFYLAIPTLGSATIYYLAKSLKMLTVENSLSLLVGAVVAGIVSYLFLDWLLGYISEHSFTVFGWYRIMAGLFILVLVYVSIL